MSNVTVTMTVGVTCHYWLTPQANEDITGAGVTAPNIVHGYLSPVTPQTLSLVLDNAYRWDVDITFRNAPPIQFDGFNPLTGGDLLTLMSAQGWSSL